MTEEPAKPKKKRGRPKGSKGSKTRKIYFPLDNLPDNTSPLYHPEFEGHIRRCKECSSKKIGIFDVLHKQSGPGQKKLTATSKGAKNAMCLVCWHCGAQRLVCGTKMPPKGKSARYLATIPEEERKYRPCTLAPLTGSNRCGKHGGKAARGPASPAYRHGGYSKVLPAKMAKELEAIVSSQDLLSAREEVGLMRLRIQEILQQFEGGGGAKEQWAALIDVYGDLKAAFKSQDIEKVRRCLTAIGRIIESGNKTQMLWDDLRRAVEDKTRLAQREDQRLKNAHAAMTTEQVFVLIGALYSAVKEVVTDQRQLSEIGNRISGLLGVGQERPVDKLGMVVEGKAKVVEGKVVEGKVIEGKADPVAADSNKLVEATEGEPGDKQPSEPSPTEPPPAKPTPSDQPGSDQQAEPSSDPPSDQPPAWPT